MFRTLQERRDMKLRSAPKEVKAFVEKYPDLFTDNDDDAWDEWVKFTQRRTTALVGLLDGDFRNSIKARSMFVIFVTNYKWIPFYWDDDSVRVNVPSKPDGVILDIPPDIEGVFVDMILAFISAARRIGQREYQDALAEYNKILLTLLGLVNENLRERIFTEYDLRDTYEFANQDESSGYQPFAALMVSRTVDYKWKRAADTEMRRIVRSELSGTTKPRTPHENALAWYQHFVMNPYRDELLYPQGIFVAQIAFLMSLANTGKLDGVNSHRVYPILKLLADDELIGLRRKFADFVLSSLNQFNFSVYDDSTCSAAEIMSADLRDTNPGLANTLDLFIEVERSKADRSKVNEELAREVEKTLLDNMR